MISRRWKSELDNLRTFGPQILFRYLHKKDDIGAVNVQTKFGSWHIRPDNSDLTVMRQIYLRRDYDTAAFKQHKRLMDRYNEIVRDGKKPVIIDAGANIGAASVWFSTKFPDAKIYAIEPDPQNAELCRRNTVQAANVQVIEAAVGSTSGHVVVAPSPRAGWAVQTKKSDSGTIPVVCIKNILNDSSPNNDLLFIKIDIEGFEADLFSNNTEWIDDAFAIIIELHDQQLPGQGTSNSFQNAMLGKYFEILISGENLIFIKQ